MFKRSASLLFASLCLVIGCTAQSAFAPAPEEVIEAGGTAGGARVFSATRQINALAVDGKSVWAATAGGVLRRDVTGAWRKWTRAHGLPSHEIRRVEISPGKVRAVTPRGVATLNNDRWHVTAEPPVERQQLWRGQSVSGTHELLLGQGPKSRRVPLPASRGSHISAVLPRPAELLVALYGDGVWRYDGKRWTRTTWGAPPETRVVTALAGAPTDLWLGTRRHGVWHFDGKAWTQAPRSDEPFDANVQNMVAYGGALWSSSLEDGIARFNGKNWRVSSPPDLSTGAARALVPFRGTLHIRHGNGVVDSWDGRYWKRDVFKALPRRKAYALAADESRLYAAQWGGWSEWDGRSWTHRLLLPELQGVIIVSLLADGDDLWLGTQNRGVGHWNRRSQAFTWQDERAGLPDDWITCLARQGGAICAGTFVGGLAVRGQDGRWAEVAALRGQNVTALEPDGQGGLWIATRGGLWYRAADGGLSNLNATFPALDTELQALCAGKGGVWVGARTGIYWVPRK